MKNKKILERIIIIFMLLSPIIIIVPLVIYFKDFYEILLIGFYSTTIIESNNLYKIHLSLLTGFIIIVPIFMIEVKKLEFLFNKIESKNKIKDKRTIII